MAQVIEGVLREELANSLRMRRRYEQLLRALGIGSLAAKRIRGHSYHYLALRERGRLRFRYLGKLTPEAVVRLMARQRRRAEYRRLLADVKRQIIFLEKALRVRRPTRRLSRRPRQPR